MKIGWTCLHWAAHLGEPAHVAALLDAGARFLAQTTLALALPNYEWPAGTTAGKRTRKIQIRSQKD